VELLNAPAERQQPLIERLRDTKGVIYTDALATVIPRLTGPVQNRARDALAERFTRMSASTLRGKLSEDDVEVRVAAIRACATKEDKSHVPDLIPLLADPERRVARASQAALKLLTGKDANLPDNPTPAQRARAVEEMKAWWQKQGK
jgi:HEAT repeat protein